MILMNLHPQKLLILVFVTHKFSIEYRNEKDSLNYAISSSISIASKVNKWNKAVQKTLINVVKNNIKALGWHLGVEDENEIFPEFNFIDVPKAMERVSIKDK